VLVAAVSRAGAPGRTAAPGGCRKNGGCCQIPRKLLKAGDPRTTIGADQRCGGMSGTSLVWQRAVMFTSRRGKRISSGRADSS